MKSPNEELGLFCLRTYREMIMFGASVHSKNA